MLEARILVGDAVERLRELPYGSVRTCVTSPPYWGLRDYGQDGQIGLEETPAEFVERLCRVFDEVWRVLADDGTVWVNLGDSYADKSLAGVPWLFAFAMRDRGWYLRQDIIWSKPNPMPESVTDRCTKAHEYIFLFSKSLRYYFDQDAIREPVAESTIKRVAQDLESQTGSVRAHDGKKVMKAVLRGGYGRTGIPGQSDHQGPRFGGNKYGDSDDPKHQTKSGNPYQAELTRNKRSVWNVSVASFKDAHFAVYPSELITPCILAGSAENDIVLDPFSGSGTTGEVALKHGRNYVGIELNPDYAALSEKRITNAIGMFGEVRVD